jgi:hypothetical protein
MEYMSKQIDFNAIYHLLDMIAVNSTFPEGVSDIKEFIIAMEKLLAAQDKNVAEIFNQNSNLLKDLKSANGKLAVAHNTIDVLLHIRGGLMNKYAQLHGKELADFTLDPDYLKWEEGFLFPGGKREEMPGDRIIDLS